MYLYPSHGWPQKCFERRAWRGSTEAFGYLFSRYPLSVRPSSVLLHGCPGNICLRLTFPLRIGAASFTIYNGTKEGLHERHHLARARLLDVAGSGALGGALAGAVICFGSAREFEFHTFCFTSLDVLTIWLAFELVKVWASCHAHQAPVLVLLSRFDDNSSSALQRRRGYTLSSRQVPFKVSIQRNFCMSALT